VLVWFVVGLLVSQAGVIFLLLTRRRVAEQERVDSEKLFRQIVDSSPIGICIVSDGNFVFVNQAYVTMFGYESAAEIVGRPVEELYAPEESSRQRRYAAERAAGHPVPTNYDVKGQKKDGSIFSVSAWVSRSKFQGKHSSLGFVIDRSVEKDLRTRLDHVNRMEAIGTLAGGIAHDFNNILTAIIGYSELAHLRCQGNEPVCSDLRQVLSAGHRAKGLVQQILTFSRNQKGELELVRLSELVEEVVNLVRASLPTTIDIRLDLRSQAQILGNAVQIHQLLMNLCANAQYELRGKRGILEISLQDREESKLDIVLFPELKPGRYVQLTVADNGPGIPEAIRERIFEPFLRRKRPAKVQEWGFRRCMVLFPPTGASSGWIIAAPAVRSSLFCCLFQTLLFVLARTAPRRLSGEWNVFSLSMMRRLLPWSPAGYSPVLDIGWRKAPIVRLLWPCFRKIRESSTSLFLT